MQLYSEDRKVVTTYVWVHVPSPEIQLNDFGIMKGGPISKNIDQFFASLDARLDVRHDLSARLVLPASHFKYSREPAMIGNTMNSGTS